MKLTDQEQVIVKAIGHGVAEISRVIRAVGYPKATTKKVLVRLSEKGIVILHRHDWPQSLTPEQRKMMVKIGSDYFNAVSMRKRNPTILDERIPTRDVASTLLALSRSPFDGMIGAYGDDVRGAYAHPKVLYLLFYAGDVKKEDGEYRIPYEAVQRATQIVDKFYNDKRKSISGKQFLDTWRKMKTKRNPKSKSKTALKKTGRALKGFARGALQSGAEILGAGAMALNPAGPIPTPQNRDEYKVLYEVYSSLRAVHPKTAAETALFKKVKTAMDRYDKSLKRVSKPAPEIIWQVDNYNKTPKSAAEEFARTYWQEQRKIRGLKPDGTFKVVGGLRTYRVRKDGRLFVIEVVAQNPRRKRRNSDHKDSDHPIEVTKHWRAGPPGYLTPWQRAHHAGQHDLFAHGIKPAKKRNARAKSWLESTPRNLLDYGVSFISKRPDGKFAVTFDARGEYPSEHREGLTLAQARAKHASNLKKLRAVAKRAKPNASRTISTAKTAKRRAGASSKAGHKKTARRVRSVAKARKASTRRASNKTLKKSSRVGKRRNAGYQWHGLPQRIRFISGEYKGMTGVVQSVIQKRYTKEPTVYRIQIDGFPKPGGWSGKVTAEPHQLEPVKENPLIQPGRRYKMKPDYEPTAIIEQGMRGGFKAVFIAKDGMAGQVGGFSSRQEATAWARAQGFKVVQKTKKRNPSAESIRKTFAGSVSGERDLFFPQGTPAGKLAKLGKLVSITTEAGTIKPAHGTAWLCADTRGKLHIGSTSNAPLFNGPARSFGHVKKLEYESSKPHLGYGPTIWFHKAGEENGIRPTLRADGKGGLVFKGGAYRLTERGIEN